MASMQFNVRDIKNLRPEADWLADTTYFILPNETVSAIITQTVGEGEAVETKTYVRNKVNYTDTKKLFKELTYSDGYFDLNMTDVTDQISSINTVISKLEGDVSALDGSVGTLNMDMESVRTGVNTNKQDIATLKTDMSKAKEDITANTTSIATNTANIAENTTKIGTNTESITTITGDVSTLKTDVTKLKEDVAAGPDTSALEEKVTKNTNDIKALDTNVTDLGQSLSSVMADLEGKLDPADISGLMPKTGGTFTGAVSGPTPASTSNDTTIPTTAWVKTAIAAVGGGSSVILSSSQPTGQKAGDLWFKQL